MDVIVTGSSGYIGSAMCKLLTQNGHTVYGVDLVEPNEVQRQYIHHFSHMSICDDFLISYNLLDIIDDVKAIFHFAATADVGLSMTDPALFFENNIGATSSFIRHLIDAKWNGHFVFSSSAAVYGDVPQTVSYRESQELHPINPYGSSKLMCEQMLEQISHIYNMKMTFFRYFNVAGAWDDIGDHLSTGHIIPRLCKAKYEQVPFALYGDRYPTKDGTCVRDYVHVRDICRAHLHVLNNQHTRIETYNLGNGTGYSNKQIVDTLTRIAPGRIEVQVNPARKGDPAILVADNRKFVVETLFKYEHNLEDMARSAWEYYYRKRGEVNGI